MVIKIITELDEDLKNSWEQFVLNHPDGNFFQSPVAFTFFKSVKNHQPFVITAYEDGKLQGILSGVIMQEPGLKGYFSRRCIIWGGPLCKSYNLIEPLIGKLKNYLKNKAIYTEFRPVSRFNVLGEDKIDYLLQEKRLNILIDLRKDLKSLQAQMHSTRRRQIQRGYKRGLEITLINAPDEKVIETCFYILQSVYKKIKLPYPSISFFKNINIYLKDQVKIFAAGTNKKSYIKTTTSGSTGRQLIYYISKNAYGMINAAGVRGWYWAGYELGDRYIKITQNKRHSTLKILQDFINRGYLYTHQYNELGFYELIKLLNNVKPTILRSYPDPLIFISNYIIRNKIDIPHIGAVTTTGNTLFKETRQLIEKSFNSQIFDSYSCEGSTHADECITHSCYHLSDEYAITEIIDEKGDEVKPGERGLLITTDLWNYVCPFIRYDTRDYVVKSTNICSCGRGLSSDRIEGRDNDILITPDGNFLIAQTFTTYFKYFESIEQFQVLQNTPYTLLFKLVINEKYNAGIENKIIRYWEDYTNRTMKIIVEPTKEISLRTSGKRQFLVRHPSIKLY